MDETTPIGQAREHLEAGRALEAMNILMEAWNAGPGDPALRLELARVAREMKSLRHRQILCRDIGDSDPRFGREIDERYLITERLSESLGVTLYRASDEKEGGELTLWHLEPLWRGSTLDQDWVLDRLGALQAMEHPSVARVGRFGAPTDDLIYATLDPADGSFVSDCIATAGPFPLARGVQIIVEILEAIGAAHQAEVFHGNLRPDHVVLREGGVRILDLGLYPLIRQLHRARKMTRTGQVPGALAYLPPEFQEAGMPDAAWDVCTAGAIAFEILTGGPPYGHPESRQLRSFVIKMMEPEVPRACETEGGKGLPEWVDEILARMLARDPEDRLPSPAEAIAAWRQHA